MQTLVSLVIYTIALSIVFESIAILSKNVLTISSEQQKVEDFENIMFYLSEETRGKNFSLIRHANWSVLLLDEKPVVGFEILHGNVNTLRRIVAKGNLSFLKLCSIGFGLHYVNTHFAGFNTIYSGKESIDLETIEDLHLFFKFGKKKFYLR